MAVSKLIYLTSLNRNYNTYQRYYLTGISDYCKRQKILIKRKIKMGFPFVAYKEYVGQYILTSDNEIKFAIDAHDSKDISSPEILEWADIYFKSNKWKSLEYPEKVLPIVNGNGILTAKHIKYLKSLKQEKIYDLGFISRIWGGREHNIKLFEQLAKVNCKKKLLAIFVKKEKEFECRLIEANIPYSYNTIPYKELNKIMVQSRCIMLRAGKHLCIPWRMIDLLCLGACIVIDHNPYPQWPVPLIDGENYVSLDIERLKSGYEQIPEKVGKILSDVSLQEKIRQNNLKYFANYATPLKIAEYIFAIIKKAK